MAAKKSKTRGLHVLVGDSRAAAENYAKGMRHALRSDGKAVKGRVKIVKTAGGRWAATFKERK